MTIFLIFFVFVFAASYLLGWFFNNARIWGFVDIIYYPLAAIGVSLLFVSNSSHRDLVEADDFLKREKESLNYVQNNRPEVSVNNFPSLFESRVSGIENILKWEKTCSSSYVAMDPYCLALEDLPEATEGFLDIVDREYSTFEEKLLAVCDAGDEYLKTLRESSDFPIANRLSKAFKDAKNSDFHYLEFDSIDAYIDQFGHDATEYAKEINDLAFEEKTDRTELLLKIDYAEIEYAKSIFRGLSDCLTAPTAQLEALSSWKHAAQSKRDDIERLENKKKDLKQRIILGSDILWMQLYLWPYVLVLALGLKFAKGVSSLKSNNSKL